MDKLEFWQHCQSSLQTEKNIVLILIADSRGETPNGPGARLCVCASPKIFGTVGGGASEFALVKKARRMLEQKESAHQKVVMQHKDGTSSLDSGMICGGEQTFLLIPLDKSRLPLIGRLIESESRHAPACLRITDQDASVVRSVCQDTPIHFTETESGWIYTEKCGVRSVLSVIGGGHVSLALSKIAADLDFFIQVLDDRDDVQTMAENSHAEIKQVIDYEMIGDFIPEGPDSYVCIMTFGHQKDFQVLSALIHRPLKYLGMMGSQKKIRQIFDSLREQGVQESLIRKVHSPIGLPIQSNTPQEIAVSIAAELIAVRNG